MDEAHFQERLDALKADRRHGAAELARLALGVLAASAAADAADAPALRQVLDGRADRLVAARPSMAAIRNLLALFKADLAKLPGEDLERLRETAAVQAKARIVESETAASAAATHARLGGPGSWLLTLPAEHVAGVQVVLRALLADTACVVQDVRDGFRPDGLARATGRMAHGTRRYTSLVPTQLARILDHGGAPLYALAGYDAVLVGGAALDPRLRGRALAEGIRVVTTYGMSETCGGCVYDGVPLDGVEVTLDPADGRVVLGGPVVAGGYLGAPEATAEAFVSDGGVRRFRTGDLGALAPDGTLTVLGRVDDVVNTGGEKVAPAAVERALLAVDGVRAACVVGLPDDEWGQIVAALVVPSGAAPDDHALCAAVRAACGRAAVPRLLLRADTVPERGIGKPDRTAVAEILAGARRT